MTVKIAFLTSAVAAAATFAAPASAATYLTDGFESPQKAGINYGGYDDQGAYFDSGSGIQQDGSPFGYAKAPEGNQTAHIQGTGSFSYFLDGFTNNAFYTLTFYVASRPGYPVDGLTVSYLDGTDPDIVTIGPDSLTTAWTPVTTTFQYIGTSGSMALTFAGTTPQGNSDYNVGVDNISLTDAVPEPATWAMMVVGFGMVGFGLRSRRKRSVRVTYA